MSDDEDILKIKKLLKIPAQDSFLWILTKGKSKQHLLLAKNEDSSFKLTQSLFINEGSNSIDQTVFYSKNYVFAVFEVNKIIKNLESKDFHISVKPLNI